MEPENKIETESQPTTRNVSFSQYSWWMKCPRKWFLDEVKELKQFEDSINTCFGTAIHEVIQKYIETLYTKNAQEADSLDIKKMFLEAFDSEITTNLKQNNVKIDDDEYTEFVYDGYNIIDTFLSPSTRMSNFPSKKYEFVGVEQELFLPLVNNVNFKGYIDLVLRDKQTGKYKIYDFKTSSTGWNSFMKDDESKYSQLLLYKAMYSKKFNVSLNMIDVEFFILKRKLFENVSFPQSHIQKFIPDHSNKSIVGTLTGFTDFVKSCFNEDGTFITEESAYPKIPGDRKKNCKYCKHKKVNCDAKPSDEEKDLQ